MSVLLSPMSIGGLSLKNRVVMSPMCQYSVAAKDGVATDWHMIHYASRAIGGAGLVIIESTGVEPDGRITDRDLGLWSDDQMPALARVVDAVHAQGAKIALQISHAGRKAQNASSPAVPSVAFRPVDESPLPTPHELTLDEVTCIIEEFGQAARRAVEVGFDAVEVHGAHGYLIHQFMSPLLNQRTDAYGADRSRFGAEVVREVRAHIPVDMPLLMRISAVEYMDGGYGLSHALELCQAFRAAGVDAFDVSSGGEAAPGVRKPGNYPGYQVPFARAFKERFDVPVIAVGMLEDPLVAESVLANGDCDLVAVGRGMLWDAYWTLHAEEALTGSVADPPVQYERAYRRHAL